MPRKEFRKEDRNSEILEEMKKLNCWICASFLSFSFESGIESVNLKNFSCEKY